MSALAAVRTNLVAAIAAQLPDVQVLAVPPAEDLHRKEGIWVARAESEFEWRSLGGVGPSHRERNRSERVTVELAVHVYRESADQGDAAEAALARAEELLAKVEDAIETDFSVGQAVTHALVAGWSVQPVAREGGWSVTGVARVEAENYPI